MEVLPMRLVVDILLCSFPWIKNDKLYRELYGKFKRDRTGKIFRIFNYVLFSEYTDWVNHHIVFHITGLMCRPYILYTKTWGDPFKLDKRHIYYEYIYIRRRALVKNIKYDSIKYLNIQSSWTIEGSFPNLEHLIVHVGGHGEFGDIHLPKLRSITAKFIYTFHYKSMELPKKLEYVETNSKGFLDFISGRCDIKTIKVSDEYRKGFLTSDRIIL